MGAVVIVPVSQVKKLNFKEVKSLNTVWVGRGELGHRIRPVTRKALPGAMLLPGRARMAQCGLDSDLGSPPSLASTPATAPYQPRDLEQAIWPLSGMVPARKVPNPRDCHWSQSYTSLSHHPVPCPLQTPESSAYVSTPPPCPAAGRAGDLRLGG